MTTYGPFTFDAQNDADCQEFTFTSNNGGAGQTTAGVVSVAGTAAEFCHDTNGGNSVDVGPDQGQGGVGDGYLYTETSSPGAASDEYTMTFDTVLDASAEQWQFNFYTCQRGPAIGNNQSTCEVQINESGGGWVTVTGGSFGGSGQDTTDGTAWTSHSVDLSDGGVNNDSSTQVRLLITTVAATVWHGDYGVDTVEIVGTLNVAREQEGYRFRNDDGSETTATWAQDQDTPHSMVYVIAGEEYPITNYSADISINNTLDSVYQSFTGQGSPLKAIELPLEKVGAPAGSMTLVIKAHSGVYGTSSEPTGAALATAVSLVADDELDDHYHIVEFMFDGSFTPANGTTYVWELQYSTGTATDYVNVGVDDTTPTHGGNFGTYDGATYTPVSGTDSIFNVIEGREDIRLRILTDTTGDAPAEAPTLSYKEVGDPDSEWTVVETINN